MFYKLTTIALNFYKRNLTVGSLNLTKREKWLKKKLSVIPKGSKILDAGAGELQYKKFCKHLKYTSQDFGKYDGFGNKEGLHTKTWDNSKLDIISDIINIPVQSKSFDAIMCIEVFEHLPEPAKAVREFSRILKKGGILIITAPFCSITHFAPHYYANGYSKYWYKKILTESGFTTKEIQYNGNYFDFVAQEIKRISKIANDYSDPNITHSIIFKFCIITVLKFLEKLSRKNKRSEEVLCFGLHVLAVKN